MLATPLRALSNPDWTYPPAQTVMRIIPKPFFCKVFGHTWQYHVEDPKIVWTASKNMSELEQRTEQEPRFFQRCVRCGLERSWDAKGA